MGCRKLYGLLEPFMLEQQIKMGRDALFSLLADHGLLVRRRRRAVPTTMSLHRFRKYPNMVRYYEPTGPNRLWVSDITYWKTGCGNLYISLVTDAFSHRVVGYRVGPTLEASESIHALRMALSGLGMGPERHPGLIHHSDRGIQYCCAQYVTLLGEHGISISMTENGDPLENSIAERINGILKEEYLSHYQVGDLQTARKMLEKAVTLYNSERPHMSIGYKTPDFVHATHKKTMRQWKNYWKKNPIIVNQ
jgi:transposase InsO family protein